MNNIIRKFSLVLLSSFLSATFLFAETLRVGMECTYAPFNYKNSSGELLGYGCMIDRSNGKSKIDGEIISQIEIEIPTYDKKNLPKHLEKIKAIKPGSRNL